MAVYTHISDDDFGQLLGRFALGEFIAARPISEGVSNTNYLLEATSGRYIFTVYEKMVKEADLPYFMALMEHLAGKGIPCPQPIHALDGSVLQDVHCKKAAITSFLHGKSVAVRNITSQHCAELGGMLARLHLASEGFTQHRANDFSPQATWQRFSPAIYQAAEVADIDWREELETAYATICQNWETSLPQGIIHADLAADNMFFEGDKASGLIDFYFACNDSFAYDIAICLNCWCFEHHIEFNITKAAHLLRGYTQVRPLSAAEREALPVLAAGAALRFLLTRLHDWVNRPEGALVTPHNPTDYLHRLRFHLQVKSAGEYGL